MLRPAPPGASLQDEVLFVAPSGFGPVYPGKLRFCCSSLASLTCGTPVGPLWRRCQPPAHGACLAQKAVSSVSSPSASLRAFLMADAQAQVSAPPTVVDVGVKRSARRKGPSCSHQRNRIYLAGALQGRKQVLASLLRLRFCRFERRCVRPLPKEGCRPTEALPSALLVGAHVRLTGRTCQALICEMVARRLFDCVVTLASWTRGRRRFFPIGAWQSCYFPRPQLPMACRGGVRLGRGLLP